MNYYERHLGDYAKDTALLSQGQVGAYDLLLDYYYATEKPLPLDGADLLKITRATNAAERNNTAKVIKHFFTKTEAGYVKGRVEEEIKRYRGKSAKASASANARWKGMPKPCEDDANAYANALPTNSERIADALPMQCLGNAHQTPDTKEKLLPESSAGGESLGAAQVARPTRGSRLPADWILPNDWRLEGEAARREAGLPVIDAVVEASRFRDYWHAQAGQKGVKLDWLATWRNWMRNARANGAQGPARPTRLVTPSNAQHEAAGSTW